MLRDSIKNTLVTIAISLAIGAVVMAGMGYDPVKAYGALFTGAFVGKFNFGGTLERFVPLLLTALAFAVSSKVSVFNVGVEGELYIGAITAAWAGVFFKGFPAIVHIPLCFLTAMAAGAAWAAIPGALKAYLKVNETCTTILLNYVATFFTSFVANSIFSAGTGIPQTPPIAASAQLVRIMRPSRANIGVFVALGLYALVWFLLTRTAWGYRIRSVGTNPGYASAVGINAPLMMVVGMAASGAVGGLAGSIEVMGIYGYFLDSFSPGIAFDGMLASLIAKNDLRMIPVLSFFLAALKAGALGMERLTGVPKSLLDAVIAIFILLASLDIMRTARRGGKRGREAKA
jgi:ABC-type uncharacterized transport system permease subunit